MQANLLTRGARVHVSFTSESRTEFSGQNFNGFGCIDRAEDGYIFGRLDDGTPFMCPFQDAELVESSSHASIPTTWVIVEKSTNEAVMEIFNPSTIKKVNKDKYEVLTYLEWANRFQDKINKSISYD